MKLINKMLLGAAALVVGAASSYPRGFSEMYLNGTYPQDMHKREALKLCQAESQAFVAFLASDREECYRQMRSVGVVATYSGVWSKPDRQHIQVATAD